jgi:hypothetical protein
LKYVFPAADVKAEPTNAFIGAEYEIVAGVAKPKFLKSAISLAIIDYF